MLICLEVWRNSWKVNDSSALWYQWAMCLHISIAEKEICWHLFNIVLLELKNYFVECCLKMIPQYKEDGVTLCMSYMILYIPNEICLWMHFCTLLVLSF